MLRGQIMDRPLLVSSVIAHAARYHADQQVVTRTVEGPMHRYTYAQAGVRMQQLALALQALGVKPGDRVATLAWNTFRHFELYYTLAGIESVCHTVNPRLFRDELVYIFNHAADRFLFLDLTFVPLVEPLVDALETIEGYVILTDREHMPETSLPNAMCYEELVAEQPATYQWPEFDENTACMLCYTSGTTGNPKGSLYSNRSVVLHALYQQVAMQQASLTHLETELSIVPMFHVGAWGLPFICPMVGAKLVLPGPRYDGPSLFDLMEAEGVSVTAGVPTIVTTLLATMRERAGKPSRLRFLMCGGSAPSEALMRAFEEEFAVTFVQGWGMTETGPVGAINVPTEAFARMDPDARFALKKRQGKTCFGMETKIVNENGERQPEDGVATGELAVRGPYVIDGYFEDEAATEAAFDAEGWFLTGDVASIDPEGYLQLTDRRKDLIKSGGEWISSIDLENTVMAHPAVSEAAAIACHHPKWEERPLLVVVPNEGHEPSKADILEYLTGKVANWWLPDDVVFVEELPHGATGKVSKKTLRERFRDYQLPTA